MRHGNPREFGVSEPRCPGPASYEVGGSTQPEYLGTASSFAASLQRFTGKPIPACLRELHGGILQVPWPNRAPQPTPWIGIAFPIALVLRG